MIDTARPVRRLSFADRHLAARIVAAMASGVHLGTAFTDVPAALDGMSGGTTNVSIAMGVPLSATAASSK